MRLTETADGLTVETPNYRLALPDDRPFAVLSDAAGTRWAELALLAAIDTAQGLDDTAAFVRRDLGVCDEGWRLELEAAGGRWRRKVVTLSGDDESIRLAVRVEGDGDLTDVRLLGGSWSGDPRTGTGETPSRRWFETLFSPEPADPARVCRPAGEPTQLDAYGDARTPGRAHWLFTPPPFCFGFARTRLPEMVAPAAVPEGPWLTIGLAAPVEALTFGSFRYEPGERSFSLLLRYEGQTHVEGAFETPALLIRPADADPYEGIARYAGELRRLGLAPHPRPAARWWAEPMFCGWGEQTREAERAEVAAPARSRQERYEAWLERLELRGLRPGTIVVDDRWQAAYGTSEPDPERWPDLRGFVARRHEHGQRVLLWWKAWDPEGLPPELCVRNSAGVPVTTDPSNPAYEAALRAQVRRLLGSGPAGYDADGLKVDFTGRTPSGPGLTRHGTAWGPALLHRLLWIVADEARATKPDALVVTHAPNPAFADVSGMLRLNDMQRLDEPDDPAAVVPQMVHRARVARAACPGILVDTDDWCPPDLAAWRAYLQRKSELGVPSLYYVEGLEGPGDDFDDSDYEALRRVWAAWRVWQPAETRETAETADAAATDSVATTGAWRGRRHRTRAAAAAGRRR